MCIVITLYQLKWVYAVLKSIQKLAYHAWSQIEGGGVFIAFSQEQFDDANTSKKEKQFKNNFNFTS